MKKIKKITAVLLAAMMCVSLSSCGNSDGNGSSIETTVHTPIATKQSPDKYTYYLKDYVGRNCASIGYYSSWIADLVDTYGEGTIKLKIITDDGSFADIENKNSLSQYVVTGQSIEPNTEIKYTFEIDGNGEEKSYPSSKSIEEVDLYVTRLNDGSNFSETVLNEEETNTTINNKETESEATTIETSKKKESSTVQTEAHIPVAVKSSPDKYTVYVKDYVGKNCASLGHKWGTKLLDSTGYGSGSMYLSLITTDGSYIDLDDEEVLKKYYVTSQSVEPNTEIKLTFLKDSNGEEYDNLVDTQSIEEINLYVSLVE